MQDLLFLSVGSLTALYAGTFATSAGAPKRTTRSTACAGNPTMNRSSTSAASAALIGSTADVLASSRQKPRTLTSEFCWKTCMLCHILFFPRYVCPKCDPHSKQNYPNLKKLNRADHELIRKTFKAIKQNRHSQQFMEPVDQRENPKYYEIVKEPMGKKLVFKCLVVINSIADLSIIEARVNRSEYNCLAEFLGDMTRILENCRYFNPPGTRVAAAAEGLEQWLARQMPGVREKVAMQAK